MSEPAGAAHTLGEAAPVRAADGRRLFRMVAGAGEVTVVFESGLGRSRASWGLVVPAVAAAARTVVYDRAGLGRSDPDPRPRTLARLADDLLAVVADVGGPLVLAGHSWGGPIVRVAAARLGADRVRGLVLVDASDEGCELFFAPSARRRFDRSARWIGPLARTGLYRLGARPGRVQPADVAADHRREDFSPAAAAATRAELGPFLDELAALRADPPDTAGIPTTVVTGTRTSRLDRAARTAIVEAHRRRAALPGGRLVEAARSGHLVMFDEPELVAAEVLRLTGGHPSPAPG